MRTEIKTRRERQRTEIRSELIASAHALVQEEGYESLTIRKLAQRVGLATMSVYSYFPDKQAILVAMAEDAFEELARRCEARRTADPFESLKGGLEEYVTFGLENQNEYRTIFMTPKLHEHEGAKISELEARNPAFQSLLGGVHDCIQIGVLSGDARAIATILWSVAHGAVSLIITFPLYPFGDPHAYTARVVDLAMAGILKSDNPPLGVDGECCPAPALQ